LDKAIIIWKNNFEKGVEKYNKALTEDLEDS